MSLDPTKPYGEVHAHKRIKFFQDGVYYNNEGKKVSSMPVNKSNPFIDASSKSKEESAHDAAIRRMKVKQTKSDKEDLVVQAPVGTSDRALETLGDMDSPAAIKSARKENARAKIAENNAP